MMCHHTHCTPSLTRVQTADFSHLHLFYFLIFVFAVCYVLLACEPKRIFYFIVLSCVAACRQLVMLWLFFETFAFLLNSSTVAAPLT